ncbi:MAG: hypothetical protein AAGI70_01025 [Pseudomonadota bacterium]
MSELEDAFARLDRALGDLEDRLEAGLPAPGNAEAAPGRDTLSAERDKLAAKVAALQARSAEEAELRGEAAAAVRAALIDLRAMAGRAGAHG